MTNDKESLCAELTLFFFVSAFSQPYHFTTINFNGVKEARRTAVLGAFRGDIQGIYPLTKHQPPLPSPSELVPYSFG